MNSQESIVQLPQQQGGIVQLGYYPQYTYQPIINTNPQWSLAPQQYNAVVQSMPGFVNTSGHTYNDGNQQVPTSMVMTPQMTTCVTPQMPCVSPQMTTYMTPQVTPYVVNNLNGTNILYNGNLPGGTFNVGNQQINSSPPVTYLQPKPKALPVAMTVEWTAAWVRTIGISNGWEEATQYSLMFKTKKIHGSLLPWITLDILKGLGMTKIRHRLEMMASIKGLYAAMGVCAQDGLVGDLRSRSSMSESESENVKVPSTRYFPSVLPGTTQDEFTPTRVDNDTTGRVFCSARSFWPDEQNKEVMKWTGKQQNSDNCRAMDFLTVPRQTPITVSRQTPNVTQPKRRNASPATLDHPVQYKAVCKVKIRSGKAMHSRQVAHLVKGAVVLINMIKGRRGRIVCIRKNGEFTKVGWVTLHTRSGKPLLEVHNL